MEVMRPIYQAYVDAVQGQAKAQEAQQELQLNKIKIGLESMSLAQQIQERQITAQVMQEYTQGQGKGASPYSTPGGSTPGANPTTGDDPSLRQAAMYDTLSARLQSGSPKVAMAYADKASEIRSRYYTQQTHMIQMRKEQTQAVADIFGSVKGQEDYTPALAEVQDRYGVNIAQFGLTGTYSTDAPILKSLAERSLTYKDKLNAQHQALQTQISQHTLDERVREDMQADARGNARLDLERQNHALQASWKKFDMEYKSREEARAQAGFKLKGEEALAKAKNHATTPNAKTDGPYVDALIANDPNLSTLSEKQKQMVKAEITMTARKQLGDQVTKPGDTPSWEDFMGAADSATKAVSKRVTPGTNGFFGSKPASIAARPPSGAQPKGGPLPAPISSMSELTSKKVDDQVTIGNKQYKITKKGTKPDGSDTELAEIK